MDIKGEECKIFRKNDAWLDQIDLIAIETHGCAGEIIEKLPFAEIVSSFIKPEVRIIKGIRK